MELLLARTAPREKIQGRQECASKLLLATGIALWAARSRLKLEEIKYALAVVSGKVLCESRRPPLIDLTGAFALLAGLGTGETGGSRFRPVQYSHNSEHRQQEHSPCQN